MNPGPRSLEQLEIWKEAMTFSQVIYQLSTAWPEAEKFGLIAQIRRAAVSIPTNLAEGLGRGKAGEIARFARIALGSAYEVFTLLKIAEKLGYAGNYRLAFTELDRLTKRLSAYLRHWEEKS